MFQKERGDATALPRIRHDEGDLGLLGASFAVVPRDADQFVVGQRHKRFAVVVINRGEASDFSLAEVRMGSEEAQACRLA